MELEGILPADGPVLTIPGDVRRLVEQLEPPVEGPSERLLLRADRVHDRRLPLGEFGKDVPEAPGHRRHEVREERASHPERLAPVPDRPPQDPAKHVSPAVRSGVRPVGDGRGEAPDVVGDDPVGDVRSSLHRPPVGRGVAGGPDRFEDRCPEVGVVVAGLALQHGHQALESHSGVDVPGRQADQPRRRLPVVLDEDQVPDLDDLGVVGIHQLPRLPVADPVVVELGAGPAGAGVSHLPEVVLHPEGEHPVLGEVPQPEFPGLEVGLEAHGLLPTEVRGVESIGFHAVDLGQQFERPGDRLLLEVVPERPVPQHLEEGVVVRVPSDVLEVVVLAAGPDALLGVHGPSVGAGAPTEEDVLELVHPRVREQQRGVVVRDHRRAAHQGVARLLHEKVHELTSDVAGWDRHSKAPSGNGECSAPRLWHEPPPAG